MKSRFAAALTGSILFAAAVMVGCESSTVSPEAAAMLLSEKPKETISVAEVREKAEAGESEEVAVEAQIGGAPVPFIPEHAGFFVTTSAPAHDHDHEGHDHEGHDHAGHNHEGHDHADHDHAADDHDHAHAEEHAHADEHAGHDHGDEEHVHSHDHAHDHDHAGHDPSTCPFCKQGVEGKKNLAMVKLMNGKGEVVNTSADKLLKLKEKQQVVVVGKPSLDADGNLYIEATKIYVAK